LIERSLLAHYGQHASHSGRIFRVLDIEFGIGRKLAIVALRAQVIGTRSFDWTDSGKNSFGT
jgi:hypothetical protein